MRYVGVNHLAMATGNLDETIRFWRDLLEMPMFLGFGRDGYRHYFFSITPVDAVSFFEWQGVEPLPDRDHGMPVSGPFAFDHVSIGVADEEALWELKDRLDAADIWVSEVVDHGFIHSIYTFDPNGIPLEFSHAVEGVNPRRTPVFQDRNPSAIMKEGARPRPHFWPDVETPTPPEDRPVYPGEGKDLFDP